MDCSNFAANAEVEHVPGNFNLGYWHFFTSYFGCFDGQGCHAA